MAKTKRRVIRAQGPKEVTGSTPVVVIGKAPNRSALAYDPRASNAEGLKGAKAFAAKLRKDHKVPAKAGTLTQLGFKPELDPKTRKLFGVFLTVKRKKLIR